jgi:cyclopropane-fatty-acyl-phospholipid synthase
MNSHSPKRAAQVLSRLFRDYSGALGVRLWDGTFLRFGRSEPTVTVVFRDPRALRELVLYRDPVRLARAFFAGLVDVEGDIFDAVAIKDHLTRLALSFREKASLVANAILAAGGHAAKPADLARDPASASAAAQGNSLASIAFHYDISNEFYRLWLGEGMTYSCAYFESADETLEDAQRAKLDLVCRKLRLRPNERLLDIGCGWGSLVMHAAQAYGVRAHGITLSRDQFDLARKRVGELGLADRVTIERRDYRDLAGEALYDKIASVGMFEHVGLANLPRYFGTAHRLLRPGGLFLNHGITSWEEGWKKGVSTEFINRYVFPDGELDTVSNVLRAMEQSRFEVLDVESLRPHYALTLRHWVRRLEANREAAVRIVGEEVYRVWRLYMAACALQFESGETGVYQILLARSLEPWAAPLTRRDILAAPGAKGPAGAA